MRQEEAPFVLYFHVWELDPDQPRVAAPMLQRVRQYRNLERMQGFVEDLLHRYDFRTAADYLGLTQASLVPAAPVAPVPAAVRPVASGEALAAAESVTGPLS